MILAVRGSFPTAIHCLSFRDIPFLALGKHLDQSYIKPPSQTGAQGQKDMEERLKGLGYL